ncbi:hypothetical protein T01_2211 [Trichinella spiralis]|uniref:Uncharacterized protein n=1 Tax=Trichinella spiralis TaxID=6334 RepID=A0A0V1BK81_TRISP|nr:hypothetical protein T01_2211 [Trichinella spiralis]
MSNSKQEEKAKVNQSQDELCVKMYFLYKLYVSSKTDAQMTLL